MKKPHHTKIALTLLLTFGAAQLAACGQKGPLRLPSPTSPTSPTPASSTTLNH